MGHLRSKYTTEYFLGGVDEATGQAYGMLGHEAFKEGGVEERHRQEFAFTRAFAGRLSGRDVLEIGFGRGDHIPLFLEAGVRSYHGIDFAPASVQLARQRVSDPRVTLEVKEARNLGGDRSFDLIVLYDVIEHIPVFEMKVLWRTMRTILRQGGHVVLSTPLFDNPNAADHSDRISPVMGMHCNKQTLGTLMRTCLDEGFALAANQDRFMGLVKAADLHLFDEGRAAGFRDNHRRVLESRGCAPLLSGGLSAEDRRRLVPGPGRLAIGCVAERSPKFLSQALRLVQSLRWFGGSVAGANIIVCMVDGTDEAYAEELERWGAFVRVVPRFSYSHPQSNKLRLFDLPELHDYDTVMLMDCDTLVVADPSAHLDGTRLQAKIADGPTVPQETFARLFRHYGLDLPGQQYVCTVTAEPTVWYCNAGVLVVPSDLIGTFVARWRRYAADLGRNLDLLGPSAQFCEQAALTLAYVEHPVPFSELPAAMNFPLHKPQPKEPGRLDCDPVVIHYHHLVDASGLLKGSPFPRVQRRVDAFNGRLREERLRSFNNRLFWDFRYDQHPERGSGIGSRDLPLIYKQRLLAQTVDSVKPRTILDIGCGDQEVSSCLPDALYTGIDISRTVIDQNRRRYPRRRYIAEDIADAELPAFDLTVCLDVAIHIDRPEVYRRFIERVVSLTGRCGIISGFETAPDTEAGGITFFHEPLSETLSKAGAEGLRRAGGYRNLAVWSFQRGGAAASRPEDPMAEPFFVVGCMRSGTTLLAELLGLHREVVHCPFELKQVWSKAGQVPMASPRTGDEGCPQLGAGDVREGQGRRLSGAFLAEYLKHRGGKTGRARFLSKNPHLCNKLPFVDALFPEARFIWIYRRMPDVVASMKRLFAGVRSRQQTWHYWPERRGEEVRCWRCFYGEAPPVSADRSRVFPGGDVRYLAEYWLETNRAVDAFFRESPLSRTLIVREEDLVAGTEAVIARCLAFLGVCLDPDCLAGYPIDHGRNDTWAATLDRDDVASLLSFVEELPDAGEALLPDGTTPADYRRLLTEQR